MSQKLNSTDRRKRKTELLSLQDNKCFWCPTALVYERATLDELMPKHRGGTQRWENIVVSCEPCNWQRGDYIAPKWAFEKVMRREQTRLGPHPHCP